MLCLTGGMYYIVFESITFGRYIRQVGTCNNNHRKRNTFPSSNPHDIDKAMEQGETLALNISRAVKLSVLFYLITVTYSWNFSVIDWNWEWFSFVDRLLSFSFYVLDLTCILLFILFKTIRYFFYFNRVGTSSIDLVCFSFSGY